MKFKFRDLSQVVRYRNHFLPEWSDGTRRLARHRLAKSTLINANISSEDCKDRGINNLWNAGNFSSWSMHRALHQYPQSSTL